MPSPKILALAIWLTALTEILLGLLALAGVACLHEAQRKGGDFGATGVLAAILLQLLPPILLLVVGGLNFVCLWRFRGKTSATATAKSTPAGP